MKVGKWTGKFIPVEKHILKQMFEVENNKTKDKMNIVKPNSRRMINFSTSSVNNDIINNQSDQEFISYDEPNKNIYTKNIMMLQKIKRMRKQNMPLELDQNGISYTRNHNRFFQKRFKMNPRFT